MIRTTSPIGFSHWLGWGLGVLVVVALVGTWLTRDHVIHASTGPHPSAATAATRPLAPDGASADVRHEGVPADRAAASNRRRWAAEGHWAGLPRAEQETLAPLEEDWIELSREQRHKWLEIAARFASLSKDDQNRLRDRMQEWARMSPTERSQARLSFQEARQLTATERLERWEAYQGLDENKRRQLQDETKLAQRPTSAVKRTEWGPPAPKGSAPTEGAAGSGRPRPEGAITVRAPTGATTHLLNRAPMAGIDAAPGLRVSTSAEMVDRTTLLPQARSTSGASSTTTSPAAASTASAASGPESHASGASEADSPPPGDNSPTGAPPAPPDPRPKNP